MGLDPSQDYGVVYNTYPIFSTDDGYEGAVKIYETFPNPKDLIEYGLKGLPKRYPLTGEPITEKDVARYLTSAISEVQMDLGCNITPVEHFQSCDIIPGMFESNYLGTKLMRWPASKILNVRLKFAHTQTNNPLQTYPFPPNWIALRRNRINIIPSYGSISVVQSGEGGGMGVLQAITGFMRGSYQPAVIEVQYVSGFDSDRFPAILKDLVLTVATIRMLTDMGPKLFPYSSASVSLDGISQSASLPGPMFLMTTIQSLQQKRADLTASFTKYFGRSLKMAFVGA